MRFIKLILRNIILPVLHYSGLVRAITNFSAPKYLILNYHGVVKNARPEISRNHLSIGQFEQHLNYFSKHFEVISLQSMVEQYRQGIRPKRHTLVITFDDGYENNYTNAYPILKSRNFPASIFVTAQALTQPGELLWYDTLDICRNELDWEALMNADQKKDITPNANPNLKLDIGQFKNNLKELDDKRKREIFKILLPGASLSKKLDQSDPEYWKLLSKTQIHDLLSSGLIEIGSHGLTHTNMDILNEEDLNEELSHSKSILEEAISGPIVSIAYPDGAYNQDVKDRSRKASYKILLAVNYRCEEDSNEKDIFQRFSISNTTTFESVMIQIHRAILGMGF